MTTGRRQTLERQKHWAAERSIKTDAQGYTLTLAGNLFQPLSEGARASFLKGSGDELGTEGKRGKMQALHSSSALAVNVFDYWREHSRDPLQTALDLNQAIHTIDFERTFPTGLRGVPPHLDVTLTLEDGSIIAIESKFLEAYPARNGGRSWRNAYFPDQEGLWETAELPGCQMTAEALRAGELQYRHLDAPQLLKHALGLAHTVRRDFSLWYLWYDVGGEEGATHGAEIDDLAQRADATLGFRAMTYRELFDRLAAAGADDGYLQYMVERYG